MKGKDIAIIVGVVIVSAIFSYVISNAIFGSSDDTSKLLTAARVEPISPDFAQPDPRFFNPNSLNPTKDITIGDTSNTQPL